MFHYSYQVLYQGQLICMHFVSILVKYVGLLRACVQLAACRVVTESKANCLLDLVIESYYYRTAARNDWHRTLLTWILQKYKLSIPVTCLNA